jgi:branched-chain amino acid transport system ATP-binding protein
MSQPLLSVNGLMMRFGGLLAVNNVNLDLHKKEIVSLMCHHQNVAVILLLL